MEFGCTEMIERPNHEPTSSASNKLHPLIADYVARSYGMSFINKWPGVSKEKSLLDVIIVCDLAYAVTIVKNHEPVWERDHWKETLGEIEQDKYNNCKELELGTRRER